MDGVSIAQLANNAGVVGICLLLVGLFISDKIVSGRRYRDDLRRYGDELKVARGDTVRWQNVALEALAAAKVVVPAAEVMHNLVTQLPDPGPDPADTDDAEAEVTP